MQSYQFHPLSKTLIGAVKFILTAKGETITQKRVDEILYKTTPTRIYNVAKNLGYEVNIQIIRAQK